MGNGFIILAEMWENSWNLAEIHKYCMWHYVYGVQNKSSERRKENSKSLIYE